jgi:hypothetical protein
MIEDYLDEDPEIQGQKYALLSFVSPENVLAQKDHFFFERFLQNYEVNWKVKNLETFLADMVRRINDELSENAKNLEKEGQDKAAEICRKNYIKIDNIMTEYQGYVTKQKKDVTQTKIAEDYKDFMFKEQTKLEDEFYTKNEFRTSVRGVKVRGVVRDEKEAQVRAKKLQAHDKIHNIFLAEVGKWTPWDPSTHSIENQEYAQEELNNLMKKYKENEHNKELYFEEQKKNIKKNNVMAGPAGKVLEVVNAEEGESASASANANTIVGDAPGSGSAESGSYGGLFDGPGDLALSRKMEASKDKDSETKTE